MRKAIQQLEEENKKLKTGINIIKEFLPDLYFTQSDQMIYSKDVILVYDGGGYRGKLTKEEYDLLKEVLSDEWSIKEI